MRYIRAKKNGSDEVETLAIREYPQDSLLWHKGVTIDKKYLSIFATFDIETSIIDYLNDGHEKQAIMYIWQICVGDLNGKQRDVYVGRTWDDLRTFFAELSLHYNLNEKKELVCFIHNAGYEFQFVRSIFSITKMFAVKKRVPVYFDTAEGINFRCSYKLSNMSLAKFSEEELADHGKLSGFDYLKQRFADTYLPDNDLLYCVDDVLGLHESICHSLKASGDTLSTVPVTSTGYIRRDARARVLANSKNFFAVRDNQLTPKTYAVCKAATRGGNTCANALYVGQILGEDREDAPVVMQSMDKKSSYPYEMLASLYPKGQFKQERGKKIVKDAANLIHIIFYNIRLKKGNYFPYIPKAKCEKMPKQNGEYLYDNGRVLKSPVLRTVITDIDFEIIENQYEYTSFEIIDQYVTSYGYLNKEYRDYIFELFKAKCELEFGDPYFYAKFKNKINAAFGMMLCDIAREDVTYENDDWDSVCPPILESLQKYYNNRNSFLEYQHGIWVTANARKSLQAGFDIVGIDGVYGDTDSCKYLGDHKAEFIAQNDAILAKLRAAGYDSVTVNGKTSTLGVWELDAEYSAFLTYGAKKYAYRYANTEANKAKKRNKLEVTVAGLSKKLGSAYLEKCGGLAAFKAGTYDESGDYLHGIVFDELNSGRLKAIYNDTVQHKIIDYNGHRVELTSNVALLPTTYELGITSEYADILEMRDLIFT